jgi:hypothetical protein
LIRLQAESFAELMQNDISGRWRRYFSFCPGIHHSPSRIRGDAAQYPIAGFRLFDIIIIEFDGDAGFNVAVMIEKAMLWTDVQPNRPMARFSRYDSGEPALDGIQAHKHSIFGISGRCCIK